MEVNKQWMGRDKTTHHRLTIYRRVRVGLSRSVRSYTDITPNMAPSVETTLPATRRVRKSISSHADIRRAMDKDNATVDVGSMGASRKSRSKSLGPGGLDALRQGSGNRRAVRQQTS